MKLSERIVDRLGIDPLEIKYEEMYPDYSRSYIHGTPYIAISTLYKDNYIESAKCVSLEMRYVFQFFYAELFDDERAKRWLKQLSHQINSSNLDEGDYESQELELDAFAFTKFFLKTFEGIEVINNILGYEKYVVEYIKNNNGIM